MDLKIISIQENPLLKRKQVIFQISQESKNKTPSRLDVKKLIASELNVNGNLVFVKKMRTLTGTNITTGYVNAYAAESQAKLIEPSYIMQRNNPKKETKEEV